MARYTITIEVEAEEGNVDARDMRPAVNGMLDRCGLHAATRVEVREGGGDTLDAARLRAILGTRLEREAERVKNAQRARSVAIAEWERPERVALLTTAVTLAMAREEGYRAAVNDLLGALSTEVGL